MKLKDVISEYGEYEIDKEKLESILVKPTGRWMPTENDEYYFYDLYDEEIREVVWCGDYIDKLSYSVHDVWRTHEEAWEAFKIRKAFQNASFEPDWNDANQDKIYLCLDWEDKKIIHCACYWINHGCQYYFKSEDIAQQLIDKYSYEDIAKYIFHVY